MDRQLPEVFYWHEVLHLTPTLAKVSLDVVKSFFISFTFMTARMFAGDFNMSSEGAVYSELIALFQVLSY